MPNGINSTKELQELQHNGNVTEKCNETGGDIYGC